MGRAKLSMELISKEKSRNITFKKRKEGLIRKMYEFTTLCDVDACMIIYGPHPEKPTIWPHNPDEVRRIIDIYKAKNKDSGNKTFGLFDFFHERRRKIEDEVSKLRKKNMEAKYPTWLELLNFMSEGQLRDFVAALGNKAEYVKTRVDNINSMAHARFYSPPPMCYPAGAVDLLNQNSMMMLLMNERQVIYGASSSSGVVDPMLPRYYAAPQRVLQILDPLEGEMLSEHHRIEAPTPSMPAPPSYEEINSVPVQNGSMGYFLGEAMYSYQAESDVELNLSVGDYIVIRKVSNNGWAEGECKGKAGWFPFGYVARRG